MLTKRNFSLLIALTLCFMTVPLASAHLGTPVTSRWAHAIPTIDGVISPGEWTDATVVYFTFDMRSRSFPYSSIQSLDAKFYVKNDENYIYAAAQVFQDDYDASINMYVHWDGFALLFDDNHDGNLVDGENGEGVHTYPGSIWYANNDLYHSTSSPAESFFMDGDSWFADTQAGQTNDGALNWSHTNPTEGAIGDYTFEMMIPLVGTDGDAYDLAITTLPATLGFKLTFSEFEEGTDGVYPDDPTINRNLNETERGGTFGDLVLSPPPKVGGIAAPIIIPLNELNLLTPLIWLASITIFPIALTVLFVMLKKKKQ